MRIVLSILCLVGALWTSGFVSVEAQAPTKVEPDEKFDQLLQELRAIRTLLAEIGERLRQPMQPSRLATGAAAPTKVTLNNVAGYVMGQRSAPITIVEFTDLQCPFCRQHAMSVFEQLRQHWIDTGRVRYISRDLPLDIHPQAMNAARASRCAGEQGKFWEMRNHLVRNASSLSPDFIRATARGLNLDIDTFTVCRDSTRHDSDIQADIAGAAEVGITGTPAFVIGRTVQGGRMEGLLIRGAAQYQAFDSLLKSMLDGQAPTRPLPR